MDNKIEFPITFKECPNCHSTRRIVSEVKKQYRQGKEGTEQAMTVITTPVADQVDMLVALPIPWVTAAFDICADCGTFYCFMATVEMRRPPSVGRKL